jgi:hypothetical protein
MASPFYWDVWTCVWADGFAQLGQEFFGSHEEISILETVTGHVLTKGCVLLLIFVLLNFLIAVIFLAYAQIKTGHAAAMEEEQKQLRGLKVCFNCVLVLCMLCHRPVSRVKLFMSVLQTPGT